MKIYLKIICSLLTLIAVALSGCAKKPTVTEISIDEGYDGRQYSRILVIGAAEKITFRNLFEGELVNQLRKKGIDAIPSYEILPYNYMLSREAVLSAVDKHDIDSVLITSLVARDKKTIYYSLQGTNPYTYYNGLYDAIRRPGRTGSYDVDILFLKTNLYDVQTEKLVWSMVSESEFKYAIESFNLAIDFIINQLRKDGLI